jgi:hypothetical protein
LSAGRWQAHLISDMEKKNIYQALAQINKGIGAIQKSSKNQQQGFMYRGIDDVMNELHALFAEHEVFILPEFLNIETTERQTQRGGVLFYVKATVKFTFMSSDGSGVSAVVVGEAMDSGDKATNKAMSIALKYALLQMFLIPTIEEKDPDAQTHEIKSITLESAIDTLMKSKNKADLKKNWNAFPQFQNDESFRIAAHAAKESLTPVEQS